MLLNYFGTYQLENSHFIVRSSVTHTAVYERLQNFYTSCLSVLIGLAARASLGLHLRGEWLFLGSSAE